jgi:hypothetical protein
VTRRVQEGDLPPVDLRLVRADVLGDPTGLGLHDGLLTDRVEQRRLSVVDVSHDRHDGRTWREFGLRVVERGRLELLLGGVLDRDLAVELRADDLDFLVREGLRGRSHLPEPHQDLDELAHGYAERLRQVLDRDARLDRDRPGRRRCRRLARLRRRARAVAGLAPGAPPAATLDDDAPLPSTGASAWANRAVGSFASVSHRRSV